MKIEQYDKVLLTDGRTATVVEVLKENVEYIVDVDLAEFEWDTIEIGYHDIERVI